MGSNGKEMHVTFILRCLLVAITVSFLFGPIVVRTALNYAYNNYTLGPCNFTDKDGFSSPCYFDLHHPQHNLSMFNWDLGCGEGAFWMGGPPVDNNGTAKGGYAYIDSSFPNKPGDRAQLWSPVLNPHGNGSALCLSFWTSLYGSGVGALRVYMYDNTTNSTGDPIWELYTGTRTPDQWYKGEVPLALPRPFRVIFEAEINLPGESDIAIDDIALNNGTCPSIPREASKSGDCAFIVDSCGWREMDTKTRPESPPLWGRVTGDGTVLSPEGHSSMAGVSRQDSYMMFNTASYQHAPLDKGQLISPGIPFSNFTYCLSFWTYMYASTAGVPIGGLQVKLRRSDNTTVNLWRLDNHQASHWVHSQLPLPAHLNGSDRVIIEAIKGGDTRAAIAVDDITFTTPYNCTIKPLKASVHPGDCAFDRELCGWKVVNSSSTGPKWRLPAGNTKPATVKDHTYQVLGDGFVYMDVFSAPSPVHSTLQSSLFYGNPNITYCLSFWYLALETEEGATLLVRAHYNDTHRELWKLTRDNSIQTYYHYGQLNVTLASNFTIAFVSTVQKSGWVLDDVKFSMAPISNITTCALRPATAKIQ
ncbi:MAM and LDL-receptor class A domain-containing protein 2 [Nephila pilipes]|uniref:MAM and LDL-receptor class A domain-containing protein 2 n=1 Tax=Nephila pilipes TaxID=299642 RepID=A0A8X6PZN2_NEPPI|nr:MAM and LDL-receptor class A domain-containing protein 2 [Nephila pilipes]